MLKTAFIFCSFVIFYSANPIQGLQIIAGQYNSVSENDDNDGDKLSKNAAASAAADNVLLDISFDKDFSKFDPRNPASAFWFGKVIDADSEMKEDNAAFLRGSGGIVNMASAPFGRWLPQHRGLNAAMAMYDGAVQSKKPIKIAGGGDEDDDDDNGDDGNSHRVLSVALSFNCRTINAQLHPFPAQAVTAANNDPRLAACGIAIADPFTTALEFGIYATNEGVWAKYSRNALWRALLNGTFDAFDVYRHVAVRANANKLVDARIELDSSENEARYFIDNKLVWTVGDWGILSRDLFSPETPEKPTATEKAPVNRNRLVSYSASSAAKQNGQRWRVVDVEKVVLRVQNVHKMDEADPNKFDDGSDGGEYSPALVRVVGLSDYYNGGIRYFDNFSNRSSCLFGQGAVMGLHALKVIRRGAKSSSTSSSSSHDADSDEASTTSTTPPPLSTTPQKIQEEEKVEPLQKRSPLLPPPPPSRSRQRARLPVVELKVVGTSTKKAKARKVQKKMLNDARQVARKHSVQENDESDDDDEEAEEPEELADATDDRQTDRNSGKNRLSGRNSQITPPPVRGRTYFSLVDTSSE